MTGSVNISQHPVVATKLSQLREASQSSKVTRGLVHDLATLLSYEASADLTLTHEKTVSENGPLVNNTCLQALFLLAHVTLQPIPVF